MRTRLLLMLAFAGSVVLSGCSKGDTNFLCAKYKGFVWSYDGVEGSQEGYGYSEAFSAKVLYKQGLVLTHTSTGTGYPYFGWYHGVTNSAIGPMGTGDMKFEIDVRDVNLAGADQLYMNIDNDGDDEYYYANIIIEANSTYLYVYDSYSEVETEVELNVSLKNFIIGAERKNGVLTVYVGDPKNPANFLSQKAVGYPDEATQIDFYMQFYNAPEGSGASFRIAKIVTESQGPRDGNYPSQTNFDCLEATNALVAGINENSVCCVGKAKPAEAKVKPSGAKVGRVR